MAEDITTNAAQVAFYFIFALFPLLLFLMSIIGLVLGAAEDVKRELFGYLQQIIPDSAYALIQGAIRKSPTAVRAENLASARSSLCGRRPPASTISESP